MHLYVIRHGQTDFNIEDRYLGALDPPLNATGREQVCAIAACLPLRGTTVISSPLLRAQQSAHILAVHTHSDLVILPDFRERHVGVFEGLTHAEAQQRYPELWEKNITRLWNDAPPGGETIEEVFSRVASGLQHLQREHASADSIILVAHGFVAKVVRALLAPCSERDFFAYSLRNGEYAVHQLGPDTVVHAARPIPVDGLTQVELL